MGKQETFTITLDEEQVALLRRRVDAGEFPSVDAAIAAMVEAYEIDVALLDTGALRTAYEAGLDSGPARPFDVEAILTRMKAEPANRV